jgi:SAM-dependent methyltransferase
VGAVSDPILRARVYSRYASRGAPGPTRDTVAELESRSPYLRRLVRNHFPEAISARILDLGCGSGLLLYLAQQAGYSNSHGVDLSTEHVAQARRLGVSAREGDLVHTLSTTPSDSYDVVVTFDVLEHFSLEELVPVVDEVRRALKPGGRWIIHCPNGDSPFVGRVLYGDITHVQAFTPTSIRQLLLSSGFSQVWCYEDRPVVHGVRSAVRYVVWSVFRTALLLYLVSESGTAGSRILSQNLLAVGLK